MAVQDRFPGVAASGEMDSNGRASAEVGPLSYAWDLVAGVEFRRGPATFLVSWGSATGPRIDSASIGAATGMDALVLPARLLPSIVFMFVIGLLGTVMRWVLATIRSWSGEPTESRS